MLNARERHRVGSKDNHSHPSNPQAKKLKYIMTPILSLSPILSRYPFTPALFIHPPYFAFLPSQSLQTRNARRPALANPPHLVPKHATRDPLRGPGARLRLVGFVERVLEQPDVRRLHGAEDGFQLVIPEPHASYSSCCCPCSSSSSYSSSR